MSSLATNLVGDGLYCTLQVLSPHSSCLSICRPAYCSLPAVHFRRVLRLQTLVILTMLSPDSMGSSITFFINHSTKKLQPSQPSADLSPFSALFPSLVHITTWNYLICYSPYFLHSHSEDTLPGNRDLLYCYIQYLEPSWSCLLISAFKGHSNALT